MASERQAIAAERQQIERQYRFAPNPFDSVFQTAVHFRAKSTSAACNLPIPTNMAFHDLTEDQSAPPEAKLLLGLGDKFIPVPELTKEENFLTARARFERDFLIKVIFAPGPEFELPALSIADEEKKKKLSSMVTSTGLLVMVMYLAGSLGESAASSANYAAVLGIAREFQTCCHFSSSS
jgi:hypothetical protein